MEANKSAGAQELGEGAVAWLRTNLPPAWEVTPSARLSQEAGGSFESAIELRDPNGTYTTVVVKAQATFGPRDVDLLLAGISRALRSLLPANVGILVVAPWLSTRTRALLADEGINYIDLTGNALLKLDNPAVFIKSTGAERNPSPTPRGTARVKGPRAFRLIRLLADVRPPYGVRDVASAANLNPGYVSRLLETLGGEALIERSARGRVEVVDVPALIRRWAESYDLFASNYATRWIAPAGARSVLQSLSAEPVSSRWAVTGSFAAVRLSAVAAPTLLSLYCDRADELSIALGLLPADEGADVVLLKPFDPIVWARGNTQEGVFYVAPSQVAVDCLTGTGRMPSEGEAVLSWMSENEQKWRLASLTDFLLAETDK